MVVEVYEIGAWHRAGTTQYPSGRQFDVNDLCGRWEFTGKVANENIRKKYCGYSVGKYFARGAANPIRYVNALTVKSLGPEPRPKTHSVDCSFPRGKAPRFHHETDTSSSAQG